MRIALLASRRLRQGPLSPLVRLARDLAPFFHHHQVVTTEGCYRSILRAGLFLRNERFKSVGPGYRGALVHIAAGAIPGSYEEIDGVIYLIDPIDPSSNYPETNALKRQCVFHKKPFLSTSRSARLWSILNWAAEPSNDLLAYTIDPATVSAGKAVTLPINGQTIALIAHDDQKKDLLSFARDNFSFLLSFKSRVGTGTTAKLLNGLIDEVESDRLPRDQREDLQPICTELEQLIADARRAKDLGQENFVRILLSGPKGGDVQIADMILNGECKTIFFFEDPSIARPHEQDIQLLERTGRAQGKSVTCVHDSKTASDLAKLWRPTGAHRGSSSGELLLISTALNRRFNVRSIVVASDGDPWEAIREAASWYLLSAVGALAEERKKRGDRVRVTVSWGSAVAEIVDEVPRTLKRIQDFDDKEAAKRAKREGGNTPVAQLYNLRGDRYFQPEKVTVAPMQGIMAATADTAEANAVAQRLATFFKGNVLELALSSLMSKRAPGRQVPARVSDHWSHTDILLTSCAPVSEEYARHVPSTAYQEHYREVAPDTCGDFGGIYLNRQGEEIEGDRYKRIGMEYQQIAMMHASGGQSVLVVGAQAMRQQIALTVLEKRVMSVLITDLEFGRQLLTASSTPR